MTAPRSPANHAHPRSHSVEFWRARLGALASRGETSGPRVDEAQAALSWWRHRTYLTRDMGIPPERAESLLELVRQPEAKDRPEETAETAVTTR